MDYTYLSNSVKFSMDTEKTGINNNELIIGSTGSGKTKSIAEPKLTYAKDNSYVVTITKKEIMDIHAPALEKKGYHIVFLDLANINFSFHGINPLQYLHTERDYIWFASAIVNANHIDDTNTDKYWSEAAISLLSAEISYIKIQEKIKKKPATLKDLIYFHNQIYIKDRGSNAITNVDHLFEELSLSEPNCLAVRGWKQITCNAPKTANCIFSTLNNCLDKIFTEDILNMSEMDNLLQIQSFYKQKTVLFILTSPIDLTLKNYVSIIYGLLFKELFKLSELSLDYKLPIPVHFICDDFATGCKIPDFEQYISVFRAIGISVSLLIQSETQLITMYGEFAASTIKNNCDTIVFTGGMDLNSCDNIAKLAGLPIDDIIHLQKDLVIVIRRGEESIVDLRYQIYQDPEYIKILDEYQKQTIPIFDI